MSLGKKKQSEEEFNAAAETMQKKPAQILPDEPLFASQARFDSFALLELVLRLEERFGLTILDTDLDPDIFYSVETIITYVKVRLEQAA